MTEFAAAFAEISDPQRLAELSPKALARAATFTWSRMAEPVVQWIRGE